jgi:hypothetical protein
MVHLFYITTEHTDKYTSNCLLRSHRRLAPMATASLSTKKMPLPVELFSGAMQRQLPLADYARNIDLHPDILRQALTGRLNGADSAPLNALAKAINRDPEQVDLTTLACDESFSMWLKRNMEGITQHGLRARAQLDSQTLKRFLNGDLLPDSDQAERISRALYIDRLEIARVVTANMAATSPAIASQESPEPSAMGRHSNVSTELGTSTTAGQLGTGTRRRRVSSRHASAEPASLLSAVAPTTIDETASATVEPNTAATGASPIAGKRLKRASKPEAQLPAPIVAAMATHRPHDEFSSLPPVEAQEAGRDGGSVPAAAPPLVDQGLQPTTPSTHLRKSRSRRQSNQAITSSPSTIVDASTSIQNGRQPTMEEYPASQPVVPAAVDQAEVLTPPVPAKTVTEKEAGTRRPKRSTTRGLATVAAAERTPALTETKLAADDRPVAGFAAEDRSSKRASSRRRPRTIGATATDISTSGDVPSSFAAEIAPSKPDERSADISMDRTVPLVTAELAADTTTLQLSADEVRLIRHWRQLHPHGRRATLQYIGSLLVDD